MVRALNGVSFAVKRGKVLGVVGESGCGKSVTALSVMQHRAQPGKIVAGKIIFLPQLRDNGSSSGRDDRHYGAGPRTAARCATSAATRSPWSFRSR